MLFVAISAFCFLNFILYLSQLPFCYYGYACSVFLFLSLLSLSDLHIIIVHRGWWWMWTGCEGRWRICRVPCIVEFFVTPILPHHQGKRSYNFSSAPFSFSILHNLPLQYCLAFQGTSIDKTMKVVNYLSMYKLCVNHWNLLCYLTCCGIDEPLITWLRPPYEIKSHISFSWT